MRAPLFLAISALAFCASTSLAQDAMTPANQQPPATQEAAPTEQPTPAEQAATAEQPAAGAQPAAADANMQMPDIPADADNLIGKQLVTSAGEEVGEVADVLVTADGRIDAILIRRGGVLGMGESHVSLKWDQIGIQGDQISTTLTADEIEAMPDYVIE